MTTQSKNLFMIVDGDDLYRAAPELLGRGPGPSERMDYARLRNAAAAHRAGGYIVTALYFARRQPNADAFYDALARLRYELNLTPYDDGWQAVKDDIVAQLQQLKEADADVFYVGGDSYGGRIAAALRDLLDGPDATLRNVTIAHFGRISQLDDPEFEMLDLVEDMEVAPPSYYRDADQRTAYPEHYVKTATPTPATTSESALAAQIVAKLALALSEDQAPTATDASPTATAAPTGAPRPQLV